MVDEHDEDAVVIAAPFTAEELAAIGSVQAVRVDLATPCPECVSSNASSCPRCHDRRTIMDARVVQFRMPPNIRYGKHVRLAGQGRRRADGSRGTLLLHVVPSAADVTPMPPAAPPDRKLNKIVLTCVAVVGVLSLIGLAIFGETLRREQANATPTSSTPSTIQIDSACMTPEVVDVAASWRKPTREESEESEWKGPLRYSAFEHLFVLTHVTVTVRNRSSHKIWIRDVNIISRWTNEDGEYSDSKGGTWFGDWYASVVPKPRSSNDWNDPRWVSPGDTISFSRTYAPVGIGVELATTDGSTPVTTFRDGNIDWWFDSPEIRARCGSS